MNELTPAGASDNDGKDSLRQTPFASFEGTARYLRIPEESWQHPTVQEFVGLINRVHQLQEDLTIADSGNSVVRLIGQPELLEGYVQANGGMMPPLSDRYSAAELLMRVAFQILRDGFNGQTADPNYMKAKLNTAVGNYGLVVENRPE